MPIRTTARSTTAGLDRACPTFTRTDWRRCSTITALISNYGRTSTRTRGSGKGAVYVMGSSCLFERLWPIYDWMVFNGSTEEPYRNPGAPTHVITGSAGCYSAHNPFLNQTQIYSAFRSDDYGYSRMKIRNASHLYIEQVSDDQVSLTDVTFAPSFCSHST